jgi:carbon storage regulator
MEGEKMLILTRSKGQRIFVGPKDVIIEVISVKGGQVRIGITTADGIPIHREEVYNRIVEAEQFEPHPKMEDMVTTDFDEPAEEEYHVAVDRTCINPRCERVAIKNHPAGGNLPMLCEEHYEEEMAIMLESEHRDG